MLALGVLIAHFNELCGARIPWFVTSYDSVGGFFALSGFLLVRPLLMGTSFRDYAARRAWRILPSYLFIVVFFAFFLSFFSSMAPGEYFGSRGYWDYLWANILNLNFLHPDLPGVFSNLDINAVNGSLWTMKVEWQLSLTAPLVIWAVRRYRLNLRKSIGCVLLLSIAYRVAFHLMFVNTGKELYEILGRQFAGQTLYFYAGVLAYTCYEEMKSRKMLLIIISLATYAAFRMVGYVPFYNEVLQPFVISLLVLSFSLIPGNLSGKIDGGHNISYELYLCHFPILQLFAQFSMVEKLGSGWTLLLAVGLSVAMAAFTYMSVGRLYLGHRGSRNTPRQVKTALTP